MPGFMRWMAGSVLEPLVVLWLWLWYDGVVDVRTGGGSGCDDGAVAS